MNDIQRKFLNSLGLNRVAAYAQTTGTLLHAGWNYLFVAHYDMGIAGIGIANGITNFTVLLFNLIYSCFIPEIKEAIFFPDSSTFVGLKEYLWVGLPCAGMLMLDMCSSRLMMFTTGYLGVA